MLFTESMDSLVPFPQESAPAQARAEALHDPDLQELAAYAAKVIGIPVALVTELGEEPQTFLANVGFGRDSTGLEESFCAHAVREEGLFEVADAAADPRFRDNPLVTGDPHVRFYAGVPVRTGEGLPTNALCVLDSVPRTLTPFQRETLEMLARQVEARLALRARERHAAEVEADAKRNAELLRLVTDRVPVRIAYIDAEYRFRFVNDAYLTQVGLSREAAFGRTLAETLGEAMFRQAKPNLDRALAGETHTQEFEARYATGVRPIRATYVPDLDPDGAALGVVVQVIDLTEQRAAEASRRAAETRYEALFDSIDQGFAVVQVIFAEDGRPLDYRFGEFNAAFEAQAGIPAEQARAGLTIRQIAPTIEESWIETYGRIARTGVPERFEMRAEALDREYEVYAFRLGGEGSREVGIIFRDVRERLAAERALAETRGRLDAVLVAAEIGVWDYDPATGGIGADANLAAMFGLDPETARRAPAETFLARIHPDDRPGVANAFDRAAAEGTPYDVAYRTVVGGRVRHLVARGFGQRDVTGRVVRVPGAVLDVTSTKLAQEAERAATETFRTVFAQAPDDAIVVTDEARRITAWNPAAERIMGWSAEEAIGQLADMFFTPEDRERGAATGEILGAAVRGRVPDERWHLRKDGSRFWGSGTMNSLHDEEGAVRGYLKVFRDATERHEAGAERERLLAELETERARLRTFFQLAPAFLCVLRGPDLVFEYVNQAYYGLVGHRPLLGLPLVQAIPEATGGGEGSDYDDLLREILDAGKPRTFHARPTMLQRERGGAVEERFLDLAYIPLPAMDGEAAGVLVHGVDVTDQVLARRELGAANERLEARVAERTEDLQRAVREAEGFNYSISHDLRTPLRAIAMTSSVLMEEAGDGLLPEHQELLERQNAAAARLALLIDGLLGLSRLSRVELKRQPIDMTEAARRAAADVSTCAVEVQPGMTAEADPGLVHSVWQNLVDNACKFSPNGCAVRVGEEGGAFFVRDEGVGFDMRYAPKIFLPFERLVADSEFPGTGIGLANVKRIVERHGGRVWAESEPGKGSTFWFTLG